ncbi:MAG: peroxiredoxin [Candidatus Gracilibacteria bacterium]|nr:peroxiredoxin [Candidatus Gracilibacteria bacterium]
MKINLENKYLVLTTNKEEKILKLKEIIGENKTILYFYPKDNTPGCSLENKAFSDLKKEFENKGYKLVGISKDSIESHKKFKEKYALKNDLISDPELILHNELGVYGEKNNYGKIVKGVIRSSFIIDKDGNILKEYRNVKATGHAEKVFREN